MPAVLEIIRAGVQTTVQDAGRLNAAQWGVPQAGAADPLAYVLANGLLDNPLDAAVLEITFGGFQARFLRATDFAIAGADCAAQLDGQRLLPYSRQHASAGQVLQLHAPACGVRSYLALAGGVAVPLVLGSRSTVLAAQFGGFAGRSLQKGDVLEAFADSAVVPRPRLALAAPAWRPQIRILAGPQWGNLSPASQQSFLLQAWNVAKESNRMGMKLNGYELQLAIPIEMASQAVWSGIIQLPPNGQPIVLLADAQTTGGYPIIAQIILADLWLAGQCRAGDRVQFFLQSREQALAALRQQQAWLKQIQRIICSSI
jgi:5-oxoprolinase (ATP-hydrolysing) subunit C